MNLRFPNAACLLAALALPTAAFADISSTATLSTGSTFSFDTGAIVTSGGDVLWTGTSLNPQGSATTVNFGPAGAGLYSSFNGLTLQLAAGYSNTSIGSSLLGVNAVFAVHTNGGNYAKFLVTANSGGSISFQYTTYTTTSGGGGGGGTGGSGGSGGSGAANAPAITEVQNNYSYISPGLPNYGIAPGSLFIVKGGNLATNTTPVLQSSAAPGLPASLNGASISVTVDGTTTTPGLYYTSTGQLAAVLPSTTPVGTGTITVTNSGVASAAAQMVVVQSALGLDVATDANADYFSQAASASPGQTIILWGSGVGADTANNDKTYPLTQDNLTSVPMTVYIGGIQVTPLYRGRSQYPGVDQVNVVIPANVPTGCGVSVVAVSGNIVSNSITLPVAQGGGACSDPTSAINPGLIQSLIGKSTVKLGYLSIGQSTEQTAAAGKSTTNTAGSYFYSYPGSAFQASLNNASNIPSIGSCILEVGGTGIEATGLNAGTITVSGAGNPATTLQPFSSLPGYSYASLSSVPANGGAFTFTGSGGADVGAFTATVNVPPALVWTNQSSITTVNRAQGQLVTWTGGAPGTYVSIGGQSTVSTGASTVVSATFTCLAPVSAGQFTVPSYILLSLPANQIGALNIVNETDPQSFSASGLDYAYAYATFLTDIQVAYQ
jgi:uncharacterized protein (TIGR03437 family)